MDKTIDVNKINIATELAIEENRKKKEKTDEPKEYQGYLDIFNEEKAAQFLNQNHVTIKLKWKKNLNLNHSKITTSHWQNKSNWTNFSRRTWKKDTFDHPNLQWHHRFSLFLRLWPCQDYQYLNDWMIKNSYPLPLILDIIDKLKDAKYFTEMDVWWGYNNIQIQKGNEWKAASKTNKGLFEPIVMSFKMCNSPATFQSMMDKIFTTMIDGKLVIIYMDNILIFAETKEELRQIMRMVLGKLWENNLFLKAKKCKVEKTEIEYLEMIIKEGQTTMDPIKLAGIWDWPTPTTVKQVRFSLGFGNFYRKFISHHSNIAKLLNNLTKKDRKFEWTNNTQLSFDNLKKKFTKEPILMIPDHKRPFQIKSDAFKVATGAVLTQLDPNGNWHPVAFLSQAFTNTERWYKIYDKELSEIIWALKEWRHYIQRSGHTNIFSDSKKLDVFPHHSEIK